MIDAVVPGGLSDEDVKSYVQMKRPDLFGAPGAQPKPPQQPMSQSPLGATDYSDPSIPKFGGMHGGSYDIAFRDPQGQISPQTINAEAVGGTIGVGADAAAMAAPASGGRAVVRTLSDPTVQHAIKMKFLGGAAGTLGAGAAYKFLKSIGLFKGAAPVGVP
jgi:hypothetical protein